MARTGLVVAAALLAWLLVGPGRVASASDVSARVALGRAIFFDPSLSEPHGTSCASCHEPSRAFSGDHGSGTGVATGSRPGVLARRSTPSLLYLAYVPRFRFYRRDDDRGLDPEPSGGFFWDGRSDSIAELVRQPLLNPREMNNASEVQIADKLRRGSYVDAFEREFPDAFDGADSAVRALGVALQAFLTSPQMAPFSSKFDDYVRGKASLTPLEAKGLQLFEDPKRGNCAKCHTMSAGVPEAAPSMFTDYGYESAGTPRNARLARRDADAGLCERTDTVNPSTDLQWCASFRTPSLRNVALRKGLMHNGAFTRLRDVVRFYATRSSAPELWYPTGVAFDDTPAAYRGLVDVTTAPYDHRKGGPPAFDDSEIDAIVAFLETLTDRDLPAASPAGAR